MERETFMGLVQITESTQPCFQFNNFAFEFILSLPLSWITNYGNTPHTTAYLLINNAFPDLISQLSSMQIRAQTSQHRSCRKSGNSLGCYTLRFLVVSDERRPSWQNLWSGLKNSGLNTGSRTAVITVTRDSPQWNSDSVRNSMTTWVNNLKMWWL